MHDLSQYVLSGLSVGCIYAFVALGLVVVAQVTGVFNFATGEYVMVGGMIVAVTTAAGWPLALAVVASTVGVAAVALAQERVTVAPVRGTLGPLGMVIASLGVGVLLRGIVLLVWEEDTRSAPPFQEGTFNLLGASLGNQVKWVYLVTAVAMIGVTLLFTRTDLGRAMRACAINPIAARLTGIRLGTMSMAAFGLAGLLCGLIAAVSSSLTVIRWDAGITIGLVGFIAAALAGFDNPIRAVLAGLALGVVEAVAAGMISSEYRQAIVYGTLIVYLLARDFYGQEGIVSRLLKSRRAAAAGSADAPELRERIRERVHAVESRVRARAVRPSLRGRLSPLMALPPILLVLAWFYPTTTTDIGQLDAAVLIVIAAISATGLGLVMGLAAQFSLGQAAFMLVSGYTAAILTADHGWNPLLALVVAVAASTAIGLVVGWMTLRLEGLNLALATLAILVIALVFVAQQESLTHGSAGVQNVPGLTLFGTTIEEPDGYFRLCLVVLAVMLLIARNLWKSRMGRALRAIGLDQEAAESVGLNAWTLKLRVFVLGAAMAGVAGVLTTYYVRYAAPNSWDVGLAINLVAYVIVGGVISPYGAALGAVVVGGLQFYAQQNIGSSDGGDASAWNVVISGGLLIVFVLLFKQGLVAIPRMVVDRLGRVRRGSTTGAQPDVEARPDPSLGQLDGVNGHSAPVEPLRAETPLVAVDGLTKRFGSLAAVSHVSFTLRPGYVTALIGPNGAGKSTVINVLSGALLPSEGAVGILGRPLVGLPPHKIAQLGLVRTFQTPRLFDGMTLLETVMLARDRHGSGRWLIDGGLHTPRGTRDERESREQALAWLAYVGLNEDADVPATTLPVGKQRMAEVARALATEPTVLLLDEPAAGLDGAETKALGRSIRTLGDAGIAVLLVEHDMSMVMSVADHVVVLEEGRKIAEGTPGEVGSDRRVIDAYLGVVPA